MKNRSNLKVLSYSRLPLLLWTAVATSKFVFEFSLDLHLVGKIKFVSFGKKSRRHEYTPKEVFSLLWRYIALNFFTSFVYLQSLTIISHWLYFRLQLFHTCKCTSLVLLRKRNNAYFNGVLFYVLKNWIRPHI